MILDDYRSLKEIQNAGSFLCLRIVLQAMLPQEPRLMPFAGRLNMFSPCQMSRGSIVILSSLALESTFSEVGYYIAVKCAVTGVV